LEIVAAVNCKGFMDVNATPDSIREWAIKQSTILAMTTAFTDGTKMNIENAVLANATGIVPEVRGMHGVKTNPSTALQDCLNTSKAVASSITPRVEISAAASSSLATRSSR
jgi:predicted homoserine dehydrogenase-like protein